MTVWDAMIGQPEAKRLLQAAAADGRAVVERRARGSADGTEPVVSPESSGALSHAWLITGPPGSGRSIAAKCLAAALQCTGEVVGCGECPGCHTTMINSNVDVKQYATTLRTIPIIVVREELVRPSYDAPSGGLWRITIIEDADRIEDRSAGALLKAVEEPPERGIWILCAPRPEDVIQTIRSRCRSLVLRTPSVDDVASYLAETESFDLELARAAAAISQSHVGVARALLKNPELRTARRDLFSIPLTATSVGTAVVAAGKMHAEATALANQTADQLNESLRNEFFRTQGVEDPDKLPRALRGQAKALEEDEKRRKKRALTDVLDRSLVDLLGVYRDVLAVQLDTNTALVNVDMEQQIRDIAGDSTPEQTVSRTRAVELARKRLVTNAAPLLVLEATIITLTGQSV